MDQEAKPRDEVESFSLKVSGKGSAFTRSCPTLPRWAQDSRARGRGKEDSHRVVPWLPGPFPAAPCPTPLPGCHSYTLTPVCTPTLTSHTSLVSHSHSRASVLSQRRDTLLGWTAQKSQDWEVGTSGDPCVLSEQNPHIPGRPGFRSSHLR